MGERIGMGGDRRWNTGAARGALALAVALLPGGLLALSVAALVAAARSARRTRAA